MDIEAPSTPNRYPDPNPQTPDPSEKYRALTHRITRLDIGAVSLQQGLLTTQALVKPGEIVHEAQASTRTDLYYFCSFWGS